MAYDETLAQRIRTLIHGTPDVTEKKMFGGLAFLVGGDMAIAASGEGGIMVRTDPDKTDTLLANSNARIVEMRGREMRGWLRIDSEDLRSDDALRQWVTTGVSYASSLPAK